ncbi:hypothetical protein RHA1_ro03087 [Rhodococcus jostii RHA1]|uniref:Uncharacterized protein n=1 Tax=Rhodococcus jostii (strain RHA1) TaxID=101510 RepID=Q0SC46_RHOJR|nr:hypothetical protein RHA1_ro03087 [Rhodococcus jostii RHA1]
MRASDLVKPRIAALADEYGTLPNTPPPRCATPKTSSRCDPSPNGATDRAQARLSDRVPSAFDAGIRAYPESGSVTGAAGGIHPWPPLLLWTLPRSPLMQKFRIHKVAINRDLLQGRRRPRFERVSVQHIIDTSCAAAEIGAWKVEVCCHVPGSIVWPPQVTLGNCIRRHRR